MLKVNILPLNINIIIKDYLWGNINDWKIKFKNIINEYNILLDHHIKMYDKVSKYSIVSRLEECKSQKRLNKEIDLEDNIYCPVCGEKTLFFPFMFNPKSQIECMCIL
tara:strand:- start:240 stop:563 length:324 start_codon:yes stop_codon:yes gene_type:complete